VLWCGPMKRLWRCLAKLWRALFRRRPPAVAPAPPVSFPALVPMAPPPILHLVAHPENRPLCGASIRQPWTTDPDAATCPACKLEGDLRWIQWRVSTR
jgi:hypothetical protein